MSLDNIFINNLTLPANIGNIENERQEVQNISLDICLGVFTDKAAKSCSLEDSVSYLEVAQFIEKEISSKQWVLVEQLAGYLSEGIFKNFDNVHSAKIKIRKFVVDKTDFVGVEIERFREDY